MNNKKKRSTMSMSLNTTVKTLVKEHSAPIILINPQSHQTIYANKSASRLFGKAALKNIYQLFSDTDRFARHIDKALKTRHHHFKVETRIPALTVTRIDTSLILIDRVRTMLLVFTDITKNTLATQSIKKKQDMLSELNRELAKRIEAETMLRASQDDLLLQQSKMAAMGEMMDAIAHQWKQPLNALSFYAGTIREDFHDGAIDATYIDDVSTKMAGQIDHLVSTLNEFRNFYRQDKEQRTFPLHRTVKGVLLLIKDELMQHGITITVDVPETLAITGIENEFKHILINLLNNAKEAFAINKVSERTITINAREKKGMIRLEIEDNAGGIPEAHLDRLFEPGFTTKKAQNGSGVGLYLCSRIAHKHHAAIRAKNTEAGARFCITVPHADT